MKPLICISNTKYELCVLLEEFFGCDPFCETNVESVLSEHIFHNVHIYNLQHLSSKHFFF